MSIFLKKHQLVFLLMLIMLLFTLFQPNFAFAQAGNLDNSPISRGLCNVFELVGGNIGKALAIFAIVMVGFGFFSGKFSIALVIGITLGIGILFGAPKIIAALTGEQTVDCKSVTPGEDVACPSDVVVSVSDGLSLSKVSYNSITRSFTLRNEPDDLAKISCYNYSSDQIRVHFTPLVSSTAVRTATTSIFTSSGGFGTIASAVKIPLSGNLSITTTGASAGLSTLTFGSNAFCPHVNSTITFDNNGACNGGRIIAYAAAPSGGSATALCVSNASGTSIGATTIGSGNITHSVPLVNNNAVGAKFIIKAGFIGDERRHNLIGARDVVVTCANGGLWNISTTSPNVSTCASDTCMGSSNSPLNFNFQDR